MNSEKRIKAKEREVSKAWESWELLLYSKLVEFDHFLEAIQGDLASAGMPYSKSGQFLVDQIVDMNEQIQTQKKRKQANAV